MCSRRQFSRQGSSVVMCAGGDGTRQRPAVELRAGHCAVVVVGVDVDRGAAPGLVVTALALVEPPVLVPGGVGHPLRVAVHGVAAVVPGGDPDVVHTGVFGVADGVGLVGDTGGSTAVLAGDVALRV